MGPPGSGKSTLARQLGAKHGLPVFHLDQAYHQPGWVPVAPAAFRAEVARIAALPAWVIDGNYTDTIAPRLEAADTLIYLDVPAWLSLLRIARRTLLSHGRPRPDSAEGCTDRFNLEFLRFLGFARSWNGVRRQRLLAVVERFPGTKIVLRGGRQQRRFRQTQFGDRHTAPAARLAQAR
jgi:adenylate kinase family enzyme